MRVGGHLGARGRGLRGGAVGRVHLRRGAARLLLPPIRSAYWPLCSSPRSAPRQCVRPFVRPFRLYRSEETTGLVQGLRGRPAQFF